MPKPLVSVRPLMDIEIYADDIPMAYLGTKPRGIGSPDIFRQVQPHLGQTRGTTRRGDKPAQQDIGVEDDAHRSIGAIVPEGLANQTCFLIDQPHDFIGLKVRVSDTNVLCHLSQNLPIDGILNKTREIALFPTVHSQQCAKRNVSLARNL